MSLVLADVQPTENPKITEITVLEEFEGMTNGEVIQALFPNMTIAHKSSNGVLIVVENLDSPYPHEFYTEWWNAPYQKGGE